MKESLKIYTNEEIAKKVLDFCLGKYKFIFISGHGGSGKTTLAKHLLKEVESRNLNANCIDMDEFMIDSQIRRSLQKEWIDINNNKRIGYYSWAFKESYHLSFLESIIHSVVKSKNSFYKSKKSNEFIEVKADAPLTIIEGVGTAFLDKEEMVYGIFVMCDFKTEVDRRIDRARDGEDNLSRREVEEKATERNEQFAVTILPEKNKFDLELWSLSDYYFRVDRDDFNII